MDDGCCGSAFHHTDTARRCDDDEEDEDDNDDEAKGAALRGSVSDEEIGMLLSPLQLTRLLLLLLRLALLLRLLPWLTLWLWLMRSVVRSTDTERARTATESTERKRCDRFGEAECARGRGNARRPKATPLSSPLPDRLLLMLP
jgi:hypothetical protein